MRIVDAQIHLWGSGLPTNMAHRQVTAFTAAEAVGLMDDAGVDAAVIHPPGWDPNSTQLAFEAVRDYPGRFAIMGSFPLERPESRSLVDGWRSQPGMLGLRYTFLQQPQRGWLEDGTLEWLWTAAERAGSRSRCWRRTPWLRSVRSRSATRACGSRSTTSVAAAATPP